jgi:hypothetical protein
MIPTRLANKNNKNNNITWTKGPAKHRRMTWGHRTNNWRKGAATSVGGKLGNDYASRGSVETSYFIVRLYMQLAGTDRPTI